MKVSPSDHNCQLSIVNCQFNLGFDLKIDIFRVKCLQKLEAGADGVKDQGGHCPHPGYGDTADAGIPLLQLQLMLPKGILGGKACHIPRKRQHQSRHRRAHQIVSRCALSGVTPGAKTPGASLIGYCDQSITPLALPR